MDLRNGAFTGEGVERRSGFRARGVSVELNVAPVVTGTFSGSGVERSTIVPGTLV